MAKIITNVLRFSLRAKLDLHLRKSIFNFAKHELKWLSNFKKFLMFDLLAKFFNSIVFMTLPFYINIIAEFPTCHSETYIKKYCGANDCQDDFNTARVNFNSSSCPVSDLESENLQQTTLYTLMGIYSAIGLFGAGVVASLVDPIQIRLAWYFSCNFHVVK